MHKSKSSKPTNRQRSASKSNHRSDRSTSKSNQRSDRSASKPSNRSGRSSANNQHHRHKQTGSIHPASSASSSKPRKPSRMAERIEPSQASAPPNGRKNGEWYVVKLPDPYKDLNIGQIVKRLPVPPKLADKLMRNKDVLKQRASLSIRLFPEETPEFVAEWIDLNILYEDEFTLIVNKPADCEIYPSTKGQTGTLANHVAAYYEGTGQACRVRHVHRLDKDTTGPVLYAKNELAHYMFDRDMREKKIERIYLAVVEGVIPDSKGTVNQPIGKDRHHSTRRRVSPTGERAITHYEVVERFTDHTLVRLRLQTGRTHQIRVHMSAIGHPLAGDGLYGGKRTWISRQALHGEQLQWNHPWNGKRCSAESPLPEDILTMLDNLRQRE